MQLKFENPSRNFALYEGTVPKALSQFKDHTFDFIFADPPYLLSNGGTSVQSGKRVSVDKADWDRSKGGPLQDFIFHEDYIRECARILKPSGTMVISGTMHSIFYCGAAVLLNGLTMLNKIEWYKPNCPPNLGCRCFTHSHETLIWFGRADLKGHTFNYDKMKAWADVDDFIKKAGKQMRDVFVAEPEAAPPDMFSIPIVPQSERQQGKYPTQKPRKLLNRLLTALTLEDDLILDPFTGSSTTGIEAHALNRRFIGIDDNSERTAEGLTALEVSEARYRAEFAAEFVQ